MLTVSTYEIVEKREAQSMERTKSMLGRATVSPHKGELAVNGDDSAGAAQVITQLFFHNFAASNCVHN